MATLSLTPSLCSWSLWSHISPGILGVPICPKPSLMQSPLITGNTPLVFFFHFFTPTAAEGVSIPYTYSAWCPPLLLLLAFQDEKSVLALGFCKINPPPKNAIFFIMRFLTGATYTPENREHQIRDSADWSCTVNW